MELDRIKKNVAKMAAQNAPESDIDGYIASEGTTIDAVREFKPQATVAPAVQDTQPITSPATEKPTGFVADMQQRGADLANAANATSMAPQGNNQQTPGETISQALLHNLAGGVTSAGGALLEKAVDGPIPQLGGMSLRQIGGLIRQNVPELNNAIESTAQTVAPAVQFLKQNQDAYDAANPRAGRDFQAARELVNVLPVGSAPVAKGLEEAALVGKDVLLSGAQVAKNVAKAPFEAAPFVPSSQQMKTYSGALFDDATEKGVIIHPKILNKIENKIDESLPGRASLDPSQSVFVGMKNRVSALMQDGRPLTLHEFEDMDKSLTGLINDEYRAKGATADATKLMDLQSTIRDAVYNPEHGLVQGSREGLNSYKDAVSEWALSKRKDDIENILQRSEFTNNPAESIRKQFATLYMDKKRNRGYNGEQMSFIKKAADSSKFAEFLRTTAGSRLIGSLVGAGVGGAATGGLGIVPGAIGGAMTGMAARGAATSLKKKSVLKLERSLASKSGATSIPKEIYDLSPSEAKTAILKIRNQESDIPAAFEEPKQLLLPAPAPEAVTYGTRPDDWRKLSDKSVVTPAPEQTKRLPAPEAVTVVNRQGGARTMTDAERQAAQVSRQQATDTGLTPDVKGAQIRNEVNKAYETNNLKRNAIKEEQIAKIAEQSSVPISQLVELADKNIEELSKIVGKKNSDTAFAQALRMAIRNKGNK